MKLATRIFRRERGNKADEYYVTSPFGWRKDPISGEYKGHTGVDYGTHGNKWEQYALEEGYVESTYKDAYGALCVRIAYPRLGYRCTHAHLDKITVSKGQNVTHNTIIGYTGTTGYSTGVHLHLGVQPIGDTNWIDPESIDYSETPTPAPSDFPFYGIVRKGSKLYTKGDGGYEYKNPASADRPVTVLGQEKLRYQVRGETFAPKVVWVDKGNVMRKSDYPFNAYIKKGTPLYDINGKKYPSSAATNRDVIVKGEINGRYQVYGSSFRPRIVYCNKNDVIRK